MVRHEGSEAVCVGGDSELCISRSDRREDWSVNRGWCGKRASPEVFYQAVLVCHGFNVVRILHRLLCP